MNANSRVLIVMMSIFCFLPVNYASASGAKAAFFDDGDVSIPTTAAKAQKKKAATTQKNENVGPTLGISYWVDLIDRNGKEVRTTTSRVFQSGDRIKLNIQSNRNGYLYVIGLGSSGSSRVLFPNAEGVANGIKARVTYAVPFDTNMKFDNTPGEEKLLVLLAKRPIPEIIPGKKSLPVQETRQLVADAHVPGAKDLILDEEVPESAPEPASYAVVPASALGDKGTLSLMITLKHR